jgi:hypothetical protein
MVIHLEAVIERVWRYALGGHVHANLQAVIERVWKYTCRPWSNELGDTLVEAAIEPVLRYTWRP